MNLDPEGVCDVCVDVVVESKGETLAADSHQEDADAVEWA